MVATGKSVSYCDIQTDCGHDAFLLPNDLHSYGETDPRFSGEFVGGGRTSGRQVATECPRR